MRRFLPFQQCAAVLLALFASTLAQAAEETVAIVSAASYEGRVAPDSLATLFGTALTDTLRSAQLDENGRLPTELGGVSLQIADRPAALVFVSPSQINFLVPAGLPLGENPVRVSNARTGIVRAGSVTVANVAPALFSIDCIRVSRGAVLNAVTNTLEPFAAATEANPVADKRTRLSIYATGIRSAGVGEVKVFMVDASRKPRQLAVEYAGPAPGFFGLDQINAVLEPEMDGLGLVTLSLQVGRDLSNSVTVNIASTTLVSNLQAPYMIRTVAGMGRAGAEGNGIAAVAAQLRSPAAVALDRQGGLWIADTANHMVRRIDSAGVISRAAGTGAAGFNGDGQAGLEAQLNTPTGLAAGVAGDVYIVDQGNHRIRRLDSQGRISTVAGTGDAGYSGDLGPASLARLSTPSSVAVDAWANLLIADTGNHRIRRVTSDGVIATIAGTGTAGFSGDGNSAWRAQFDTPNSVASAADGSVYVADGKNYRIRRITPDGTVRTLVGIGSEGSENQACAALAAKLNAPLDVAVDSLGRVLLIDGTAGRVSRLDFDCVLRPIAGTGASGFSGDNGAALAADLNRPHTLAVSATGELYFADTDNQRVRQLYIPGNSATCTDVFSVASSGNTGVSGQTVTVFVRLQCPASAATQIAVASSYLIPGLATSITIPAGQLSGSFPVTLPRVSDLTYITIRVNNGPSTTVTVIPAVMDANGSATVTLAFSPLSVAGGESATGTITLGAPAPPGGTTVVLGSTQSAVRVPERILIAEGQMGAQFTAVTTAVTGNIPAVVTASANGTLAQGTLNVTAGGADTRTITGVLLTPSSVIGGQQTAQVTVTLSEPAGAPGTLVSLSSSDSAAAVPASLLIPAGQTSGAATITTTSVTALRFVSITAASANTVTAALRVTPVEDTPKGPATANILNLSVTPSSLVGGQQSATGTVTLATPAPAGGIVVALSSNHSAANVPSSVVVLAGQATASFIISTTSVSTAQTILISASSANSQTVSMTVQPPSASAPVIGSLALNVTSVAGGQQGLTGTVTLTAPAPAGGVTVTLTSNNNAVSVPPSATVPQGQVSATFAVTTTAVPSTQTATVSASASNTVTVSLTVTAAGPATATIGGLVVNPGSVIGGQQNPTGTVTLAAPAGAGGVTITLSASNPAVILPPSVTVPAGQSSGTFNITTNAVSAAQTVTITAVSANSVSATLTISAGGPATATIAGVSINPTAVTGGQQNANGTVTLPAPAPAGGVQVSLASNNPAAGSVPALVTIAGGMTSGTFTITTLPVSAATSVTITATSANAVTAVLTINAAGPGTGTISGVSLSPSSVTGGQQNATGTVTLTSPAGGNGVLVTLSSSNSAAASVAASLTIPQGQASATFAIATAAVSSSQAAIITASSANSSTATLTVNPPMSLASMVLSPGSVKGGSPTIGTVTLTAPAPAGGLTVVLASNQAAASVSNVSIAAGQTSATFTITTTPVSNTVSATISAALGSSTRTRSLTIEAPCVNALTLSVSTILGGSSATGTVTLTGPAPTGGASINLASSNAAVQVPTTVLVPAGQTSTTFSVLTSPVNTLVASTIQALSGSCAGVSVNVSVQAPVLNGFTVAPTSVILLGDATGAVTSNGPAPAGGLLVTLSSSSTVSTLVLNIPATVTIAAGQTSATFPIHPTLSLGALLSPATSTIHAGSGSANLTSTLTVVP